MPSDFVLMMPKASPAVASLLKVMGSRMRTALGALDLADFIGLRRDAHVFVTTPDSPARAIAMAMLLSVTVSIAALTMGVLS